jgi:hypothetical protein
MCNLMEHSERSARELEARKREPVYATLADQHGIPYEPPVIDSSQSSKND